MNQNQIDEFLSCLKYIVDLKKHFFLPGENQQKHLVLKSNHHTFLIYINRKGTRGNNLTFSLLNKADRSFPLIRLDITGPAHPNPKGRNVPYSNEIIPCPHIHIAREGYRDSIAYPINDPQINFNLSDTELTEIIKILKRFLEYSNVANRFDFEYSSESVQIELF